MTKSPHILIGLDEITGYIGVTVPTFHDLVKFGLPATTIKGRWYAHSQNIDKYFERVTLIRQKEIDENAE